jgi:hypothetical protein
MSESHLYGTVHKVENKFQLLRHDVGVRHNSLIGGARGDFGSGKGLAISLELKIMLKSFDGQRGDIAYLPRNATKRHSFLSVRVLSSHQARASLDWQMYAIGASGYDRLLLYPYGISDL